MSIVENLNTSKKVLNKIEEEGVGNEKVQMPNIGGHLIKSQSRNSDYIVDQNSNSNPSAPPKNDLVQEMSNANARNTSHQHYQNYGNASKQNLSLKNIEKAKLKANH